VAGVLAHLSHGLCVTWACENRERPCSIKSREFSWLYRRELRVSNAEKESERPRRTREHIIASQSYNYIEKFFIDKGHTVDRPGEDYGYDMTVSTFDDQGYLENGEIRIQLKASDSLRYVKKKTFIAFPITRKHYELWTNELMPVFLILYDAQVKKGYWLHVWKYFDSDPSLKPTTGVQTITLRIPVVNEFTETTVDYARKSKSEVLARRVLGRI
jgi:hypothetical protein